MRPEKSEPDQQFQCRCLRCSAQGCSIQTRYANDSRGVGDPEDISLAAARLSNPADPAKDAAPQRHRSLGDDAENMLGTLFTACEMKKTSTTEAVGVQDD